MDGISKIGKPQNELVKIMENPIKNGWFVGKTHYFWKHPHEFHCQICQMNSSGLDDLLVFSQILDDLWVQSNHLINSLSTCCASCLSNGQQKNATLQTLFRPHAPSCVGPRHGVAIGRCKRYHSMKDWVELWEQIHMVDTDVVFSNSSFTEPCRLTSGLAGLSF